MSLSREKVGRVLADVFGHTRFIGASFSHNQRPTAQVFPDDPNVTNSNRTVLEGLGIDGEGVQRLEIDRDGAWVYRRESDEPELIPFDDL